MVNSFDEIESEGLLSSLVADLLVLNIVSTFFPINRLFFLNLKHTFYLFFCFSFSGTKSKKTEKIVKTSLITLLKVSYITQYCKALSC